jgi:Ca2+-binding EF-hand superfamily protein
MGVKESKREVNLERYGLSNQEAKNLRLCFNHATGSSHKLNKENFETLFIGLSKETDAQKIKLDAKRAFKFADSNHDGSISFEEFEIFYLIHKSKPEDFNEKMCFYLNDIYGDDGFITVKDAHSFADYMQTYFDSHEKELKIDEMIKQLHVKNGKIPIVDLVKKFLLHHITKIK